ncbi:MAG: hypothetical protein NC200_04955 [Candidatus Gastranaerophilales bacterium]|nr:hypothetical protein [Candidatus Gastranaerophilales bacterium]
MVRDFLRKIISFKTTPRGVILTFMGEEYVPIKSIEALIDKNKILEASLDKRIMTIKIMERRLQQNKDLIEKMHQVLDAQNRQMHEQLDIINNQRRQLKHIDQIDWRMNKLKHEQKKIIRYTNG